MLPYDSSTLLSCFLYFIIGIYVYRLDTKNIANRFFLVLSFVFIWFNFSIFLMKFASDKAVFQFLFDLTITGTSFSHMGSFVFFVLLTRPFRLNRYVAIVLFAVPMVFTVRTFTAPILYTDFVYNDGKWEFVFFDRDLWTFIYLVYAELCYAGSVVLLFIWRKKTRIIKERKQANVLLLAVLLIIIAALGIFVISPMFGLHAEGADTYLSLFFIITIAYTMKKYQLFSLSPDYINREIYMNIEDLVILLDRDMHIISVNSSTETVSGKKLDFFRNKPVGALIQNGEQVEDKIKDMMNDSCASICGYIYLNDKNNHSITVDVKISCIRDSYGDFVGILIIGHSVKNLEDVKMFFKITNREFEIIQAIIDGETNNKIAQQYNITTSTVKSHVTNIFNKLGVNNRIELINLLKEFNIIPKRNAEKTVFFF